MNLSVPSSLPVRPRNRIAHEGVITRATAIVTRVNVLRALQDADGRVVREHERARSILHLLPRSIADLCDSLGQGRFGTAFAADIERWLVEGIDTPPAFDRVRTAFKVLDGRCLAFFCGPLTTDEPGRRLEAFLALPDQPNGVEEIRKRYPRSTNASRAARFVVGSQGLSRGNCVTFSEQPLSFFNKFQPLFERETMPRVERLFGRPDQLFGGPSWIARRLTSAAAYEARAVWGALDDHFRERGLRSVDRLKPKQQFFARVLDVTKTNCQTIVAAANDPHIPWRREIVELALFDRMLRLSTEVDGRAGVLLFEWLAAANAIAKGDDGFLDIHLEVALDAMALLVWRISGLEHIANDGDYVRSCERFVRSLPPDAYSELVGDAGSSEVIDFDHLPLY